MNRLVAETQLQAAVNELIGKITAQSGAVLGMAKKAVLGGMGLSLREALRNSMNITSSTSCTGLKIRRKVCARCLKNASHSGRIVRYEERVSPPRGRSV